VAESLAGAREAGGDSDLGAVEEDAVGQPEPGPARPSGSAGSSRISDASIAAAACRMCSIAPGVGKKRVASGTRSMRTPLAACSASKCAASGCDEAVRTAKLSGSSRRHSSQR